MELGRRYFFPESKNNYRLVVSQPALFLFLLFSSLLLALNFPLALQRPFPSFLLSVWHVRLPFSVSFAHSFTLKLPTQTEIFAESPALLRHHAFGQYAIIRYRNAYFLECRQFFSTLVPTRSRETPRYNAFPYLYGHEICFDEHSHSRWRIILFDLQFTIDSMIFLLVLSCVDLKINMIIVGVNILRIIFNSDINTCVVHNM